MAGSSDWVIKLKDKVTGAAKKASGAVSKLEADMTKASKSAERLNKLGSGMMNVSKIIGAGVAAANTAFLGAVAAVDRVTASVDNLMKNTRKLDYPVEEFQVAQSVAGKLGVSQDEFAKSVDELHKKLGELKSGTGGFGNELEGLNPSLAKTLKNTKNTSEAYEESIKALRAIKDDTIRAAMATKLFGGEGGKMALVAAASGEEISELSKRARENGIITEEQGNAAEAFQDSMADLKDTIKNLVTDALLQLAPKIKEIIDATREWMVENQVAERAGKALGDALSWVTENIDTIKEWAKWIGIAIGVFMGLTAIVKVVTTVIAVFKGIVAIVTFIKTVAIAVVSWPLVIVAAIAFIIYLVWKFRDDIKAFFVKLWEIFTNAVSTVWDKIKAIGQSMFDAFMASIEMLAAIPLKIAAFFINLWLDFKKAAISAAASALSIGTAIIDGIMDGLNPAKIIEKIKSIGGSILQAAKDIFGIASPSKEFEWMGKMNVEGMADGFEDNTQIITRAVKTVGDDTISAANDDISVPSIAAGNSAGEISGGISGSNIELNVEFNFEGSGMSREDAERVEQEMLSALTSALEKVGLAG